MNYDALKVAVDLASFLFAAVACLYAWRIKRSQASQTQIEALNNKISGLELKLTGFDSRLELAVDRDSFHELALNIEKLNGKLEVTNARYEGVGALMKRLEIMTDRQEEQLLEKG